MGLKVGIVKLEEYNPKWKDMYLEEKENLKDMFGDIALAIEHIGSTSIEGLSAKPIIDIAVGVKSLSDFDKVKEKFMKEPYSVKEDSTVGEILVRKGNEDNRTHFIHVMEIDSDRYIESILYRDYLRKHDWALKEYEDLKKDLSIKYQNDRKMYTASKNDFIKKIIELAHREK
jgi:GrpB-like predicted nucleotidyltransferase (UPF0157 family)